MFVREQRHVATVLLIEFLSDDPIEFKNSMSKTVATCRRLGAGLHQWALRNLLAVSKVIVHTCLRGHPLTTVEVGDSLST